MVRKEIPAARLGNQRFSDDSLKGAHEVVSWFGAIQGQEYALTKWSIGLRAPQLQDQDVEKDLSEGRILRTHVLRPTWHFVADLDIRWMLKLTAPTVHQASAFMYRSLELNQKLFQKANKVISKALEGRALTRDDLTSELKRNKIVASGPRLAYIYMNAELEGLICSGPRPGKQLTYALLEERAKPAPAVSRDEALQMLTSRYFTSRGPATLKDFATWSGLKVSDCKRGIEAASMHIRQEKIGEQVHYVPLNQRPKAEGRMYLLPIYDEMIMGYKDRSVLFEARNKLKKPPKLRYNGMILDNGQVIGTWRRVDEAKAIKTQFDFFKRLNKVQKVAFEEAFDHLERFSPRKVEME
jgi:hypothetical protein